MATLINTTLQTHRRGSRIWLEGAKISREGFYPGIRFTIEEKSECLILTVSCEGKHSVSSRKRRDRVIPIIDITQRKLDTFFKGANRLRVLVRAGCIVISVHHHLVNQRDRETRIIQKLNQGKALSIGSLFHGGGVLDKAVHHGFEMSGVQTYLGIAVDIEGKYLDSSIQNNPEMWNHESLAIESGIQHLQYKPDSMSHGTCRRPEL